MANLSPPTSLPKKKFSFIRWQAVVPASIFFFLFYGYFFFFLDHHLRIGLQKLGTLINGAEVNISKISTSFWNGSFLLSRLEVTNPSDPDRNRFALDTVRFAFLWDALLRAKIVVREASVLGIEVHSPRKHRGFVVPPPRAGKSGGLIEGPLTRLMKEAESSVQQVYAGTILGDAIDFLTQGNLNSKIQDMESNLKSLLKTKELQKTLADKREVWDAQLKALPKSDELNKLSQRVKAVQFGNLKDPIAIQSALTEIQTVLKEVSESLHRFDETGKGIRNDLKAFKDSIESLESLALQDLADLEQKFKVPNLDLSKIANTLFRQRVNQYLEKTLRYADLARQYMPTQKDSNLKNRPTEIKPTERKKGVIYQFGRVNGYPLFWLQKAQLSSQSQYSPFSGDVDGKILDVSTDPRIVRKPMQFILNGNFPQQQLFGLFIKLMVDHSETQPIEEFTASLRAYPIAAQNLADDDRLKIKMLKATGQVEVSGSLRGSEINLELNNKFSGSTYDIESPSSSLKEIVGSILSSISVVTLNGKISGHLPTPSISLDTNLAEQLARGIEKVLNAKIAEFRMQLKKMIDGRLDEEKQKIEKQFKVVKTQIESLLNDKQKEIQATQSSANGKLTEAKDTKAQTSRQLEQVGKKAVDALKKKFKF